MDRILIIEDDCTLCNGIAIALQGNDCEIKQAHTLKEAEMLLSSEEMSLLILDINLPDGNGLSFLKTVRKGQQIPVILLTANDMETDIVTGLESGADDYITKPFSLAVLRARVNTQLRRRQPFAEQKIVIDDFSFDFGHMEFQVQGKSIELSKTEQKLLRLLVENKGQILPRERLTDAIWQEGADYVDENALSVTIKRLRDKLENGPGMSHYIKTVYGIGYTWTKQE